MEAMGTSAMRKTLAPLGEVSWKFVW